MKLGRLLETSYLQWNATVKLKFSNQDSYYIKLLYITIVNEFSGFPYRLHKNSELSGYDTTNVGLLADLFVDLATWSIPTATKISQMAFGVYQTLFWKKKFNKKESFVSASCPGVYEPRGEMCLHVGTTAKNWEGSRNYCKQIDGRLVDLNNQIRTDIAHAYALTRKLNETLPV